MGFVWSYSHLLYFTILYYTRVLPLDLQSTGLFKNAKSSCGALDSFGQFHPTNFIPISIRHVKQKVYFTRLMFHSYPLKSTKSKQEKHQLSHQVERVNNKCLPHQPKRETTRHLSSLLPSVRTARQLGRDSYRRKQTGSCTEASDASATLSGGIFARVRC